MNLNFKDIEVVNNKMGKPYYVKNKKITKIIQKNFKIKNFKFFLSISDEKNYSTAFAIIQISWKRIKTIRIDIIYLWYVFIIISLGYLNFQ